MHCYRCNGVGAEREIRESRKGQKRKRRKGEKRRREGGGAEEERAEIFF